MCGGAEAERGEQAKLTFSSKFQAKIPMIGHMSHLECLVKTWNLLIFIPKLIKCLPSKIIHKELGLRSEVRR